VINFKHSLYYLENNISFTEEQNASLIKGTFCISNIFQFNEHLLQHI